MAKPSCLLHLPARVVLLLILLLAISVLLGHGVLHVGASHGRRRNPQTAAVESASVKQPYRTSFHFQPPKNWMNDPNGPMIYKGIYHLFYQYNPQGPVPGHKVWAHSTSTDLVNWTPHAPAIVPSQEYDLNGCWSGAVTILQGRKPAILYTGAGPQKKQAQNLAAPKNLSDPYLIEWVKSAHNPLMASTAANGINASSFRDPTTAWVGPDGGWGVIVGSKRDRMGMAILYRSRDFVRWTMARRPVHSADDTGMWECPDLFPVSARFLVGLDPSVNGPNVKHVLKVSLDDNKHEYYTVGTYDSRVDTYIPDKGSVDSDSGLRYDYGKFYGSKTFFDGENNRRILWGWINELSTVDNDIKKGWSGVMAIPRTLWLDKSGKQLVLWPILAIEKLRTNQVDLPNKLMKAGTVLEVSGITAAQADVEVSFEVKELEKAEMLDPAGTDPQMLCSQKGASAKGSIGPFGLRAMASKGLEEYTAVFFRIFKGQNKYVVLMCSDQSRSSLNKSNDKTTYGAFLDVDPLHEELSLRTLIDHSIVESFGGGGKSCITARVYPVLAVGDGTHLHVFNKGGQSVGVPKLSAWSMKKARIN